MNYTQHPLSAAWPAMQADEYQALKDSIELIGVQNPITLLDGMVIDGWHRYSVAIELGVECLTKELGNIDPIDFVKSQNEARRNVTASQRALAITTIYAWKPANIGRPAIISRDEPGSPLAKTNAELAEIANTTVRTIQQAKAVQANASPEVKAAVKAGTMSVKKAAETTKPNKPLVESEPVAQDEDGAPDQAEFDSVAAAEKAEQMAMRLLLASDEPLADMTAKYEQALLQIERLNSRIAGLQNQSTHQIKTIKSLQNKLKKLEQPA